MSWSLLRISSPVGAPHVQTKRFKDQPESTSPEPEVHSVLLRTTWMQYSCTEAGWAVTHGRRAVGLSWVRGTFSWGNGGLVGPIAFSLYQDLPTGGFWTPPKALRGYLQTPLGRSWCPGGCIPKFTKPGQNWHWLPDTAKITPVMFLNSTGRGGCSWKFRAWISTPWASMAISTMAKLF